MPTVTDRLAEKAFMETSHRTGKRHSRRSPSLIKVQRSARRCRAPSARLSLLSLLLCVVLLLKACTPSLGVTASTHYTRYSAIQAILLNLSGGASAAAPSSKTRRQRSLSKVPKTRQKSGSALVKSSAKKSSSSMTQQQQQDTSSSSSSEDPRILFLIRFLFLTYYGSLGSLLPYLPVYYDSLGHGGAVIGLLGAVKPFTTFLVAPAWGLIADQTQQPFTILQLTFLVSLLGQLFVSFRHDVFYIMCMVFVTALFSAPVKSLIDSMVMDHINDRSSYGKLRLWGQMGFGIGSSGVGLLLSTSQHIPWPETTSFSPGFEESLSRFPVALKHVIEYADKCWQSMTGYKLLFFAHAALSVPTWICIRAFRRLDREQRDKIAEKGPRKDKAAAASNAGGARIGEGLLMLLHNGDALLFFFLVFVVGLSSGVIENFAYVRMREVGGTGKEMGLSRLISSIAGAPMFWFSGPLSEKLGADRVLVLSLLSYVTRFIIYAMMKNPYHGLPAEALRGVTFAAFWSTCTIYAHRVSPDGLHATMLMFLNAMYGGLGQSLGAIVGGKLQNRFGTVKTFIYSAVVDFCFTAILIVYLSLRKDSSFHDPKPIEPREKIKKS